MRIFITGMGGFLGGALAEHFVSRGHEVTGSRHGEMRLGEPFDTAVFKNIDTVIYCSHDFTAGARRENVDGTQAWFSAATAQGVQRQVFLSSYSAQPDADSEYGQTKHEIEGMFLQNGQAVLRPGLVMGDGGLFLRQRNTLLRTPIVPLLGDGMQPVVVISLKDFLDATAVVVEKELTGAFNLFQKPMTYREFVSNVKSAAGQRTRFLTIPVSLAMALARAAEVLHLPIPVKPGQIKALIKNQKTTWQSDLGQLLSNAQ